MDWLNRLFRLRSSEPVKATSRITPPELLETRCLMAADVAPIQVGLVYIEADEGSDISPDRFLLNFKGGAPETELKEFTLDLDKDGDGLTVGDLIFDTEVGGRGKGGAFPFVMKSFNASGAQKNWQANVSDGGTKLVVTLSGFRSGDSLEFTLDVDEVVRMSPDLATFNQKLDELASGQEFEDSILQVKFSAPHFYDVVTNDVTAPRFLNDYVDPYGLNLPSNKELINGKSLENRNAGTFTVLQQKPLPIQIGGTVWVDDNLNLIRETNETVLPNVQVSLFRQDAVSKAWIDTGLRRTTDAQGKYLFGKDLNLELGTYRVVETQPNGFFSVGAKPGQIAGQTKGTATDANTLSDIVFDLGDTSGVNYDFAEARPAEISGFVYRDDNDDGLRGNNEVGIGGVTVRLVPISTIATQATLTVQTDGSGAYRFTNLSPGTYRIEEVQPVAFVDGKDTLGKVDGVTVGVATNDLLSQITLNGNSRGIEYNFGELLLGSISGTVFLEAPGEDCDGEHDGNDIPLANVSISLLDATGKTLKQTTTNAQGAYRFDGLLPGIYTVVEVTPTGLIEGMAHVGIIDGVAVGLLDGGSRITNIQLPAGKDGIHYDFCEANTATISGSVYHDASNEGRRDANESGIANATVRLQTVNGQVVATTTTDGQGRYAFDKVLPGTYEIVEVQPTGYLDGLDAAGTISGAVRGTAVNPGDRITQIVIKQGETGINYDFGEILPASISGIVHIDLDDDCVLDANESTLEGVVIRLLDASGKEIAQTKTDAAGKYQFLNLAPGSYTVVEDQPAGLFDGGHKAGTAGGDTALPNQIRNIVLGSGTNSEDNIFCEHPPAEISGIVFSDLDQDCLLDPIERGIAGVQVDLLDSAGRIINSTFTDADGRYRFANLVAGEYTVVERQPAGFLQGGQMAGSKGGDASTTDKISKIPIGWGEVLVDYNFCEILPASLSGHVYHDIDGDCEHDPSEPPLSGVRIDLFDANGVRVATQFTDSQGNYKFDNLKPGTYSVIETQPEGYLQGGQVLGSGGGRVIGPDHLGDIAIRPGDQLVDYDFCEWQVSSLSGQVWKQNDFNKTRESEDIPLKGIVIELLDPAGKVLQTTQTNATGQYRFDNLMPGEYQVREQQPTGLFSLWEVAGSHGGDDTTPNLIAKIIVPPGQNLTEYNFIEQPPAAISGYVFQDGDAILNAGDLAPQSLRQFKDGARTSDDAPLSNVLLELRDLAGNPISASEALPGTYSGPWIRVTTDASGYYEFNGLREGSYHVYQVQPDGYIDGLDTAGTLGGYAVNAADAPTDLETQVLVQTLAGTPATNPNDDAILKIALTVGMHAQENNFSEVLIQQLPPPPQPPIDPPPERPNPSPDNFAKPMQPLAYPIPERVLSPLYLSTGRNVTWHLSVINAGYPRGENQYASNAAVIKPASAILGMQQWMQDPKDRGRWRLMGQDGELFAQSDEMKLGDFKATPVIGDFDGDGRSEAGIYIAGNWYIDLNGNGLWDPEDLWVSLGTELDRPVVGDWDGDGKDDVGIFGPEWYRDAEAIINDPGLPDPENPLRSKPKNPPPTVPEATDGGRLLRRTPQGNLRADLIDHVFRYGQATDVPLAGDWNGDGIDTVAVFRDGRWMLDVDGDGRWTDRDESFEYGQAGDLPVVGDWDGDGIDDLGVRRGDYWILDKDGDRRLTDQDPRVMQLRSGAHDEQPVAGDWNGDGVDEVGTYESSEEPRKAA